MKVSEDGIGNIEKKDDRIKNFGGEKTKKFKRKKEK